MSARSIKITTANNVIKIAAQVKNSCRTLPTAVIKKKHELLGSGSVSFISSYKSKTICYNFGLDWQYKYDVPILLILAAYDLNRLITRGTRSLPWSGVRGVGEDFTTNYLSAATTITTTLYNTCSIHLQTNYRVAHASTFDTIPLLGGRYLLTINPDKTNLTITNERGIFIGAFDIASVPFHVNIFRVYNTRVLNERKNL
ncbi:hypothetical protein CBL_02033 [Carabus blaptoides fortunei]